MKALRSRLPPPNALVVFEAVARLLSFTAAARELGVSQAATSRQVQNLEEDADSAWAQLFDRLSPERVVESIASMRVELVLTPHPTEVLRRTLMLKYDAIGAELKRPEPSAARLERLIAEAWHTEEHEDEGSCVECVLCAVATSGTVAGPAEAPDPALPVCAFGPADLHESAVHVAIERRPDAARAPPA